jgi:hypothetical protein
MAVTDNEYVFNDNTPVGDFNIKPTIETPEHKAPGFFRSLYEEFKETTPFITAPTALYDYAHKLYLGAQQSPEGWSAFNTKKLEGLQPTDYADILSADSQAQQDWLIQEKIDDYAHREWLDEGSIPGRVIGGLAGFIINPIKYPNVKMFQSLSKPTAFFANAAINLPGNLAESVVINALDNATHATKTWQDTGLETLRDGIFGAVQFGGLGLRESFKLNKRLDNLKYLNDDIEWVAKFKKGTNEFDGWKAEPLNDSVGAARVSEAQKFVDEGLYLYGESGWFKKLFTLSPVTRMMTNPFLAVREWGGAVFRPSGVLKYKSSFAEADMSAEQIMKGYIAGAYNAERQVNNLWESYIGINHNLPAKETLGLLKKKFADGNVKSRAEFTEEVGIAFRNGDKSTIPEVEQAARIVRESVYSKLYNKAVELELLPKDLDPITAISYLNKNYHKDKIMLDPVGFKTAITDDLMNQVKQINEYTGPINSLRGELKDVSTSIKAAKEAGETELLKVLRKKKKVLSENISAEQKSLNDRVLSKEIEPILVSERVNFTKAEQAELEALREKYVKPREKLKTKEERAAFDKMVDTELGERVAAKSLNEKFYNAKAATRGKVKLKDPLAVPGLRKAITDTEAKTIAENAYMKILNMNSEQMFAQAFEERFANGGTNPLHRRTLMVRDNSVQNFLVNDINQLSHVYTNFMSRMIGLEESLKPHSSFGYREGLKSFTDKINTEFSDMLKRLEAKPRDAKRDTEIKKLHKEKDKAIDLLNKSYKAYWGNYNLDKYSSGVLDTLGALRAWTVSTGLGALPLVQIPELGNIIGEYGLGPFLADGLFPTIKNAFSKKNLVKQDLAHAKLAIDRTLASYSDRLWGHGSEYSSKSFVPRVAAVAANKLGNITGSNLINDTLQEISGRLSMSRTIEVLDKYVKGVPLTKIENERLFLMGINKQKYAKDIIEQFSEHGTIVSHEGGIKAYEANFHLWGTKNGVVSKEGTDAMRTLLNGIQQEVESVIIKPNIADLPFAFRDPVMQSITLFMGYSFAQTQMKLINTMQRPTANKMMGILTSMTLASFVNPLRELISGKEPDLTPKALMASAITNGFPGGYFIDIFNRLNSTLNIPVLNELKNDRYRGKGAAQLFGGAIGTAADDIVRLMNIGFNVAGGGGISESDVRKAVKALPWTSAWQFRYPVDQFIKSLELPQKARPAEKLGIFSE